MEITWSLRAFAELTPYELHDLLRLRVDVFVIEQRCIYPEIDGQDTTALHLMAVDTDRTLVAYARILPPHGEGPPHIGRVIVHPGSRGKHLGRRLMHEAIRAVERTYGSPHNALAAQAYLVPFYSSLGYSAVSEEYPWDGIPHVDMVLGER